MKITVKRKCRLPREVFHAGVTRLSKSFMEKGKWVECQFLRFIQRETCVIRIESSGAIVQVYLVEPLDISRACVVSAIRPVYARIQLGKYMEGCFHQCRLDIKWPEKLQSYDPPMRFIRRARPPQKMVNSSE